MFRGVGGIKGRVVVPRFHGLTRRKTSKVFPGFLLPVLLTSAFSAASQQTLQPFQEYDKKIRAAEQMGPLKSDLFGDSVSLYDQRATFQHTDVSLSGNNSLPVAFERRLVVRPRSAIGDSSQNFGGAADWDIEVPSISGVFDSAYGWTQTGVGGVQIPRCSANLYPRAIPPHRIEDIWSGYTVNIPGRGSSSLIGMPHASHRPGDGKTRVWLTREFDSFSCTPMTGGYPGEGFVMLTTSGVEYTFNVAATRSAGLMGRDDNSNKSRPRVEIFILASRIEDRFGNYVNYTYNASGHPVRIEGSDGRRIDIAYDSSGRVVTATAHGQIWSYQYAGDKLVNVVLPDQSKWTFAYQSDMRIFYEKWTEDPGPYCLVIAPFVPKTFGLTMTHPSGAIGTFGFSHERRYRAGVPLSYCVGETPPTVDGNATVVHHLAVPNYFDVLALKSKSIHGPGISQPMNWLYQDLGSAQTLWSGVVPPCTTCTQGKGVQITQPDGSKVLEIYGIVFAHNEGKLLSRRILASNNSVLRTETFNYMTQAQVAAQPFPDSYGSMYGGNDPSSVLIRPLKSKIITQSGTTFTWTADTFDVFARPTSETKTSTVP